MLVSLAFLLAGAATAEPPLEVLFEEVAPSVVMIRTTAANPLATRADGADATEEGLGSGVLVSLDGKVMTAAHVVQAVDTIEVRFTEEDWIPARVLSSEPAADVALIQLERLPGEARVAKIGDSDRVQVGDEVLVVGAPYGLTRTLTVGYISGRHRSQSLFDGSLAGEFFQTDAAINSGNSGGPLFNRAGEVIGIVSHILSSSGGSQGIGFAATSNLARGILIDQEWAWSGMEGHLVRGDLARVLNVPPPGIALLVQRVAKDSPSERLGLRGGDTAAEFDGEPFLIGGDLILEVFGIRLTDEKSYFEMRDRVRALRAGDEIHVKILRDGKIVELRRPFGGRKQDTAAPSSD